MFLLRIKHKNKNNVQIFNHCITSGYLGGQAIDQTPPIHQSGNIVPRAK
jgi:hypothetical protein